MLEQKMKRVIVCSLDHETTLGQLNVQNHVQAGMGQQSVWKVHSCDEDSFVYDGNPW